MNTKSTAPGTRASPRAWARKANVSASHTTAAHRRPGDERPARAVRHRRRGRLELALDDVEVGAHGLPRRRQRERPAERRRVVDPRHRPGEHDQHQRDGDERRHAQQAQQVRRPVADDGDQHEVAQEVVADEHPAEPDGDGDRVGEQGDGGGEIEAACDLERLVGVPAPVVAGAIGVDGAGVVEQRRSRSISETCRSYGDRLAARAGEGVDRPIGRARAVADQSVPALEHGVRSWWRRRAGAPRRRWTR